MGAKEDHAVCTDQRALILLLKKPKRLYSHPIAETNVLELSHYSNGLSIVLLKYERVSRSIVSVGFEFITGGQALYDQIEKLSFGAGPAPGSWTWAIKFED